MSADLFWIALFFIFILLPILAGLLMRKGPNAETGRFLLGGGVWTVAAILGFVAAALWLGFDAVPGYLYFLRGLAVLIILASPLLWVRDRLKKTQQWTPWIWFFVGGGIEILLVWQLLWRFASA